MPVGCVSLVPTIIADLAPRRPRTILDLGIGFGFWGAAIRQWLDNGVTRATRDGSRPSHAGRWDTYLMGVEGFAAYRSPAWDLYDYVHVMDIEQYVAEFATDRFDAILFLDVIEHFPMTVGEGLLAALKRRLNPGGVLYVGTPGVWIEQGDAYGNKFECHRSMWDAQNFRMLGFGIGGISLPVRGPVAPATYVFDGMSLDPWGNRMILAKYTAPEDGA